MLYYKERKYPERVAYMKRILSILLTAILLMGLCLPFTASAAGEDITAAFTDLNFRSAVYQRIGKIAPAPIYDTDAAGITEINLWRQGVQSLAGLEYLTGLKILVCHHNKLSELPDLPASLTHLICSDNQLTSLPTLPAGLQQLGCDNNLLTSLPALPPSMTIALSCSNNMLTSLPTLPALTVWLTCDNNQLTVLPELPSSLLNLYCHNNLLATLPTLPAALQTLKCNDNPIEALPALPPSLRELHCYNCRLTSLPVLPSGLQELNCINNRITGIDVTGLSLSALDCRYNDMAGRSDVKGLKNTWDNKYFRFDPQGSKAYLNTIIAEAKGFAKIWYTSESWGNLQTAMANAQTVADDPSATREQIFEQGDALERAMYNATTRWDDFWNSVRAFLSTVFVFLFWPLLIFFY